MTKNTLRKIVRLLARIGADPSDSDDLRVQKTILVVGVSIGILLLILQGVLYTLFNEPLAGAIPFAYAAVSLGSLVFLGLTRRGFGWFKFSQLVALVLVPFSVTLSLGGLVNSGGPILWGLFGSLSALILHPSRASYWFGASAATIIASLFLQPFLRPANNLPPVFVIVSLGFTLLNVSSFVFVALSYFVGQKNLFQEKSENLLLNILPKEIVAILKSESRTIADRCDGVSILFADVVNFTPMSAQMAPAQLVELLNEVFSHFDALVEKHNLEKIKTIGDCYMVAAGVPRPRPDHAQALARMALEMRDYVGGREFQGKHLSFRIGINSGPVIAGVIGRKKFIYDLWGDAVNTASRMESNGTAGKIQITRATYDLIKDEFTCEPRGTVAVKGKGEMEVWHILGERK